MLVLIVVQASQSAILVMMRDLVPARDMASGSAPSQLQYVVIATIQNVWYCKQVQSDTLENRMALEDK